jgi:uncharacterized protein
MLLDTSGILCFLDAKDFRHQRAVAEIQTAPIRLTHSYVLAELVPLADARKFNRESTLEFISTVTDDPEFRMVWVGEALHRAALQLLRDRRDKQYSLCDAVSFVLMREHGVTAALTTDHHFEQEGFVKLLQSS